MVFSLALVGVLTWLDPIAMFWLWVVPLAITHVQAGYFAWLTHAPAGVQGSINGSMNTANNWLGLFIFNQGYHQVHHEYPGIHWTDIPDRLDVMLDVVDFLIEKETRGMQP